MHAKQLILFSLTAVVALAEPVANRMERRQYSSVDYNSLLAAASSEIAMLSGMPTLPASVESVLATAIPTSILTNPAAECSALNGKEPDWYKSLPSDVKSALTSYESAASSWLKDHPLPSTGTITGTIAATGLTGCGATGAAAAAATATGTTAKGTQASATATGAQAAGTNAAARPASAVAAGLAGAVGLLGLVIAL